jgi:hypothetical protein
MVTGSYAASFLPMILVPLMPVFAAVMMGLFFMYVESDA